MSKRIIFTGGSGLAGRYCIEYLLSQGHSILNLDVKPLDLPGVTTLITDLTDAGQVFNALSHTPFSNTEYDEPLSFPPVDALIHFAAFPRPLIVPDNKTFTDNVSATYNIIDTACKLGIRKIVLASTQSIYGIAYSQHAENWAELPIFEDSYDCNPTDSYGLSKVCAENIGRSFAKRFGIDIYALRIGYVVPPGEFAKRMPGYLKSPHDGRRIGWSYTDARDLGQICDLCVAKDRLGFQVFNAVNDSIVSREETMETIEKGCPNARLLRDMGKYEAPTSNEKIKKLLGFREKYDWKTEMEREQRGQAT